MTEHQHLWAKGWYPGGEKFAYCTVKDCHTWEFSWDRFRDD